MIYSQSHDNKKLLVTTDRVANIKHWVNTWQELTPTAIQAQVRELQHLVCNEGVSLAQILPQSFALTIIAIRHALGLTVYDVQVLGAIALWQNKVIEMQTGEGKTLVAALPAALYALQKQGVHVITVNDYLVVRDATEMGRVYAVLGLSVAYVVNESERDERQRAYRCDITYVTSNEAGFDYLRDNLVLQLAQQVQRPLHVAIIDEVDSVLLDEANIPLIISESNEANNDYYILFNNLIETLIVLADVLVEEKENFAYLKDSGYAKIETCLMELKRLTEQTTLYTDKAHYLIYLNACLQAHYVFQKNRDYLVQEQRIVIVSEKTGRAMEGRRWAEGLHQAMEAKEKLKIIGESTNLATITFQNFFKLYRQMCGMTGTAVTEAAEFLKIYNLETVAIPTNKPVIRHDHPDVLYATEDYKFRAIVEQVELCLAKKQPVLIGTSTIVSSEKLSALLKSHKIKHHVLNAKYLKQEATIVAQAGAPGAVTIATNMAGRGTDIILGGNPYFDGQSRNQGEQVDKTRQQQDAAHGAKAQLVKDAGGLFVIIAERHRSRRIDNQLRGRCARQGEPGESRFYLSLDDPLIRVFADPLKIDSNALTDDEQSGRISLPFFDTIIRNAQKTVEGQNFNMRKQLLEYDSIVNEYRLRVYQQRQRILTETEPHDMLLRSIHQNFIQQVLEQKDESPAAKRATICTALHLVGPEDQTLPLQELTQLSLQRVQQLELRDARQENQIVLECLNNGWKDYLNSLPTLRRNANLNAYAQLDPLNIFEKESHHYFMLMIQEVRQKSLALITATWHLHAENQKLSQNQLMSVFV